LSENPTALWIRAVRSGESAPGASAKSFASSPSATFAAWRFSGSGRSFAGS
jgi:hypothetical protein